MEIAKLIVDLIGKIIWPIVIFFIVWKFRKQIAIRLKDINEIELPGGFKAKLNKVIQATIEETLDSGVESQIDESENDKDNENDKAINYTLLAFTANRTRENNLKYDIYYDPVTRNNNLPFRYIGLYANKTIFAIGKVNKIVYCDYIDGALIGTNGYNLSLLTNDEYDRIKGIIENTDYYNIKDGIKFFLVEKFYKTDFVKSSYYPIRAKKYIWLDDIPGFREDMSPQQIAQFLEGKDWE